MKVIQIRGVNGVGKTTAVREYIRKGLFCAESIEMGGKQYSYQYDGKIAIIGNYDGAECGGVDGLIKNKDELKNLIAKILRTIKPDALIFEGVMYGQTFQFSYEINRLAKALGYEYIALCFVPPFETSLLRIWERNGGKDINVEQRQATYRSAIKSNSLLRMRGVTTKDIDTSSIPKEDMYRIIEEAL